MPSAVHSIAPAARRTSRADVIGRLDTTNAYVTDLVIWASGYRSVYSGNSEEISSLNAHTWSPASRDFHAAASHSGVALGASSLDELLRQLGRQSAGSVNRLGIIAHSNSTMVGLAGKIITTPDADVEFFPSGIIDAAQLTAKADRIESIQDRFADDASIVLFSCNSGSDFSLLVAFETAFDVDCYGFKDEVLTCTTFKGATITARGRMAYVPGLTDLVDSDQVSPCVYAKHSVWELTPDMAFFSQA
jgi:hypothetical protein